MIIEFWSVLKIEPTKDKNIIKNAYADMLKIYHPEEHPDEFLRVQKAYNDAMNYAKSEEYKQKRIPSKKTMESEMETEKETEQEKEQKNIQENTQENIPDYICDISKNAKYELSETYDRMKRYVSYISERIKAKKRNGADKEIESLFNIHEFRQIAISPKFVHDLKEEIGYTFEGNLMAVRAIRANYSQLAEENPGNKSLTEYVDYWERREAGIKNRGVKKEIILVLCLIMAVPCIVLCSIFIYRNSGPYIFRDAPTESQVSTILYDRYGVDVEWYDIVYVSAESAPGDIGRAVSYEAELQDDEMEIPFHCIYGINMNSPEELQANLGSAIFQAYFNKYVGCDYYELSEGDSTKSWFNASIENLGECNQFSVYDDFNNDFNVRLEISNTNTKEQVVGNMEYFAKNFFANNYICTSGKNYVFNIYMSSDSDIIQKATEPTVVLTLNAENYQDEINHYKETMNVNAKRSKIVKSKKARSNLMQNQ